MAWQEGHAWRLDIALPPGDVTFKVVRQDDASTVWEQGADRTASLPEEGASASVAIECVWGSTDTTSVAGAPRDVWRGGASIAWWLFAVGRTACVGQRACDRG